MNPPQITLEIADALHAKCPELVLGCLSCSAVVGDAPQELLDEISAYCSELSARLEVSAVNQQPAIAATRSAYKTLGKEPSRYRPSAEALMRRVVQGKGLYKVNNLVDLLNLVSLKSGYSIGGWDADQIEGAATLGIGEEGEPYAAIGRGDLNIAHFPTFRDAQGAFGTPTSDSLRTMVRPETRTFLMAIYAFGEDGLPAAMEEAKRLLMAYAGTEAVDTFIIQRS